MTPDAEGRTPYDVATGNDADSDRHGIVTPDAGLMNPNHYLAVAIQYLYGGARPGWSSGRIGKTLVSSSMIDRVAAGVGGQLVEVPVGDAATGLVAVAKQGVALVVGVQPREGRERHEEPPTTFGFFVVRVFF